MAHDVHVTKWGRRRQTAMVLFALVVAEFASVVIGWLFTGMSFASARDSFMITNTAAGVCCGICGVLIAWHRPENRLGWLLLGAGVAQTATAGVTPWFAAGLTADVPVNLVRWLSTAYSVAWPWSVALFIPLALVHFPDGRLPGRAWQAVALVIAVNAPVQVLLFNGDLNPLATVDGLVPLPDGRGVSWLHVPGLLELGWPAVVSEVVLSASYVTGLVLLVVRYRRGDDRVRQQLLWLLLATFVAVIIIVLERLPGAITDGGFPIIATLVIVLVPAAMTIAVLRYKLLDIRLVWSRTLTYGLLTAAVVGVYLGLVQVADQLLRQQVGLGTSVLATLVVAAGFNPLRVRLQRGVDRLLYGERADPVRAAASVTARLASGPQHPTDVLPALCHALRLPYAGLREGDMLRGEHGEPPEIVEAIPLQHAGDQVGELLVGVRSGQHRLDPADRAVLELMAVPIGVALRASALSAQVQDSRRAIVTAREEERRQLRRELHDGLGPTLTGIAFQADAIVNLADSDPGQVRTLGADIRGSVSAAIQDVRHLIYQLRPAALDELGLVEALRRHVQRLDQRADGTTLSITVTATGQLPELPAAVEVAAYRIATEALTNVTRHSCASTARVDLEMDGSALRLTVRDDGRPVNGSTLGWSPCVGLASMRERAVELGGSLDAEPTPTGGRVSARIPFGAPVAPSGADT